jgi:hypothetical protein
MKKKKIIAWFIIIFTLPIICGLCTLNGKMIGMDGESQLITPFWGGFFVGFVPILALFFIIGLMGLVFWLDNALCSSDPVDLKKKSNIPSPGFYNDCI